MVSYDAADSYLDHENQTKSVIYLTVNKHLSDNTVFDLNYHAQNRGVDSPEAPPAIFYVDGSRTSDEVKKNLAPDWSYNDNKHQAINARLVHDFNKEWFLTAHLQRSEAEVDLIRTFADIQPFVMPGKQSGLIAEHINYVDDYVIYNAALQLNGQFELLGYTQQIVVTASHTDANRNNDYLAAPSVYQEH